MRLPILPLPTKSGFCQMTLKFIMIMAMDGALADCNRMIEVIPDKVLAYDNRGKLKNGSGNWDDAIADFNKAIKLNPAFEGAYADRALAKTAKGDFEGAMADYNTAIKINPKNAWAYHRRGCLYYDSHDFANAMVDFGTSCEWESPVQSYSAMRMWLIRMRNGEAEAANGQLQNYWNSSKNGKVDDWPSKIISFLTGQLTESDLFNAAASPTKETDERQHGEAYFYAGSKRLFEGDKITATDCFEKCVATGIKTSPEYDSAVVELKFLKATN